MTKPFWEFTFRDSPEFIETFDELPLWSASFGLLLLKHIPLHPSMKVLDLGSGAGFPLMEIAERLGPDAQCYGLDPWKHANYRASRKIKNYEIGNVQIIEGSGDNIPFEQDTFDLIVSNLGVNNFEHPDQVFKACASVLKPGGVLALTTNLNGHWKEFYKVFEETCTAMGKPEVVQKLKEQQQHRGTVQTVSDNFVRAGMKISKVVEEPFTMRFVNGTAFLHHHFIQVGWLSSWQSIIPKEDWAKVFSALENNLNTYASRHGGLTLTVPCTYIEGVK